MEPNKQMQGFVAEDVDKDRTSQKKAIEKLLADIENVKININERHKIGDGLRASIADLKAKVEVNGFAVMNTVDRTKQIREMFGVLIDPLKTISEAINIIKLRDIDIGQVENETKKMSAAGKQSHQERIQANKAKISSLEVKCSENLSRYNKEIESNAIARERLLKTYESLQLERDQKLKILDEKRDIVQSKEKQIKEIDLEMEDLSKRAFQRQTELASIERELDELKIQFNSETIKSNLQLDEVTQKMHLTKNTLLERHNGYADHVKYNGSIVVRNEEIRIDLETVRRNYEQNKSVLENEARKQEEIVNEMSARLVNLHKTKNQKDGLHDDLLTKREKISNELKKSMNENAALVNELLLKIKSVQEEMMAVDVQEATAATNLDEVKSNLEKEKSRMVVCSKELEHCQKHVESVTAELRNKISEENRLISQTKEQYNINLKEFQDEIQLTIQKHETDIQEIEKCYLEQMRVLEEENQTLSLHYAETSHECTESFKEFRSLRTNTNDLYSKIVKLRETNKLLKQKKDDGKKSDIAVAKRKRDQDVDVNSVSSTEGIPLMKFNEMNRLRRMKKKC